MPIEFPGTITCRNCGAPVACKIERDDMHKHLLHSKTVEEFQREVLNILAYGSFLDKRTELEAWCEAAHAAKVQRAMLQHAYSLLTEEQRKALRELKDVG